MRRSPADFTLQGLLGRSILNARATLPDEFDLSPSLVLFLDNGVAVVATHLTLIRGDEAEILTP
jgi:hypothetical protein